MSHYRTLYQVKQLPIFQNVVYLTQDEALNCAKGDVTLVQNTETGLIYNCDFNPEKIEYGSEYQNEQACSSFFRSHLDDVSKIINKFFGRLPIIEIGCGKGHFLEYLKSQGFSIKGLDPAYEGKNPDILKKPFEKCLGLSADGIILRHVLEHISDPLKFLESIRDANAGMGNIYIEVPSFEWICLHQTWFDIYYEHVNYFTLDFFKRIFDSILESGYIFKGQYLYVVADLGSLRTPHPKRNTLPDIPEVFLPGKIKLNDKTKENNNSSSVIWGGSSKGVIYAVMMQREGIKFDFVIDINPMKQDKYLPGSGLRVYSPEKGLSILRPLDNIFVMNANYLEEIISKSGNKMNYILVENGSV